MLLELCHGLEQDAANKVIDRFAAMMIERRQASLLPAILEAVEATPEPGAVSVSLTTAEKAPDDITAAFRTDLEKKLDTKVYLDTEEDPKILGGAVIRYEDTLLDASVRNRLDLLKQRLAE